jgi:translocation and assembly module TamA
MLLLALLLSLRVAASPPALEYRLSGVRGELADNVRGWLGNPPASEAQRLNFLATAEQRVASALQALGHYSPTIRLDLTRSEPTWELRIEIEPGEPVRIRDLDITLTGEAAADEGFQQGIAELALEPGAVFHHGHYRAFKSGLLAVGQQRGYFGQSLVESRVAVDPKAKTADVRIVYDSGPRHYFGELRYPADLLAEGKVRSLAAFTEGDPFDLDLLRRFQGDLQRTGYFSSVVARPLVDQAEQRAVPILLELQPAPRHSFNVGIGYRTDIEGRASVTWRTPRINRAGHSQETRLEYSLINPSGRVTYNIPLSHPLNDRLQLIARLEDNVFGDLDSHQRELAVRRELRRPGGVFSYSLRGLAESWNVQSESRENEYLLPGFTFSRRTRIGSVLNPDGAFSQFYEMEAGTEELGSDVDLLRAYARFSFIASPGANHRLVTRAELGAALLEEGERDQLAPSLNFFAGGSQSIRGFAYQSIGNELDVVREDGRDGTLTVGGDRLVTASLEYQYRFLPEWRAAVFTDFGDAFDDGEFDANYSAGIGVHYLTQVGAIRVQLAYPLSEDNGEWRFHLDIGAEF